MDFDIQRNFFGTTGIKISELDQQSNRINKSQNNNLKLGLDYFINKQTTLGIVTTGFLAPQKQDGFTTSYLKGGLNKCQLLKEAGSLNDYLPVRFGLDYM